jgi:hypothetical protein
MEYIHLPFQSGSTRVLERMNRIYTREEYLETLSQAGFKAVSILEESKPYASSLTGQFTRTPVSE